MSTSVIDRKLRQVYDLIDTKQYKKALKLCNSHIQKTPHPILYAVRALILQRSGEEQESLLQLEQLAAEKPSDLSLLDLMSMTLKALGKSDRIASLYNDLFQTQPSKEVGALLFNSYASNFKFTQQQAVAIKLFKLYGDSFYGLISVTSMCIQAYFDPSQKKILDIASLFLQKVKSQSDFQNSQSLIKLELLMEELKGGSRAIEIINQQGNMLEVGEKYLLKAKILSETDKIAEFDSYHELLRLNLDQETALMNWESYSKYVESVANYTLPLELEPDQLEIERPAEIFKSFSGLDKETILKLCFANIKYTRKEIQGTSVAVRTIKRTSRLAELLLLKTLYMKKVFGEVHRSKLFIARIEKYLGKYNDIPSTIEDLTPFLELLSEEENSELLEKSSILNHKHIENVDQLRSVITY